MISCFLSSLAHVTFVWHPPSSLSKLVLCQYLSPSCLPNKKTSSYKGPRVPHYTMRERLHSPIFQRKVKRPNLKNSILSAQLNQVISDTQNNEVVMQPPKKFINILQLIIIELSNKPWTLTTLILNIYHPSILGRSDSIKTQECIP